MRRFLLDTGPAQDFICSRRGIAERVQSELRKGNRVGICTPVYGELFAGAELSDDPTENIKTLHRHAVDFVIWPYTQQAAREYGKIFARLRSRGRTIQQVDIMIAAIALMLGNCTVVTKDSDFRAIDGLDVVDWSAA